MGQVASYTQQKEIKKDKTKSRDSALNKMQKEAQNLRWSSDLYRKAMACIHTHHASYIHTHIQLNVDKDRGNPEYSCNESWNIKWHNHCGKNS